MRNKRPLLAISVILAALMIVAVIPGALAAGDPMGAVAPCSQWFLPEGSTDWGFDCYITIENPSPLVVQVDMTFMTGSTPVVVPNMELPASSQTMINPREFIGNKDFSTKVVSHEGYPIAVDREMFWTGEGAPTEGAHGSIGVTGPAKRWYLPEGSSKWGFECWLLIQNPSSTAAKCNLTYMIEGAAPVSTTKDVPPNSRKTFFMADDIGFNDASIMVEANVPVIPERAMYRNNRREGHDSIGTTTPSLDYYLAEGTSGYGFTTYVLVQNPGATAATVTVTYMTPDGPRPQPAFTMPAQSRKTVRVNDVLPNQDFSTQVHANVPIIAERAMYWNNGTGEAMHDSIGLDAAHECFFLPDGRTDAGFETWTLVQNPNDTPVDIEVSYLPLEGGDPIPYSYTLPAKSRMTFSMGDDIGVDKYASIMVQSTSTGMNIMVERAIYGQNKGSGTNTIGGAYDAPTTSAPAAKIAARPVPRGSGAASDGIVRGWVRKGR